MTGWPDLRARVSKAFRVAREQGLGGLLRVLYSRFRSRSHQPMPSLRRAEEWLSYYEHRKEVSQPRQGGETSLPRVSVLILTYNNLLLTQICLRSIFCNTSYPGYEVIVVDNGSTDGTPAWLQALAATHPRLRLILNASNRGFSAGNNQAAHEAHGDYLIFLNNDTVVTSGWIEGFLAHMEADPSIGLIGPVTNGTGNEARIPASYQTPAEMEALARQLARTMRMRSFDIRMLAFFCVMVRAGEFQRLGGLDERFGVGMFEDEDIALRYKQQGLRVVCAEDVFIHHFWRASFGNLNQDRYRRLFAENRGKFEAKWGQEWEPYRHRRIAP